MGHSGSESVVGIQHISYWLPPKILDNRLIAERHGFDEEFVLQKLGIKERRVLAPEGSLSEMASNAIKQLFSETHLQPDEVELLILVTQTGDFSIPHTSAILQSLTGISESALIFDVSLGCSGFVIGLDIAISIMERMGMKKGILVTADAYSQIVDRDDRGTAPLFGDAATATYLTQEPRWRMGKSDFGSRGANYEQLIVRGSGTPKDPKGSLHMDGRGILGFTRKVVPKSVKLALEANGLDLADVDRYVFHQANAFVLDTLKDALDIPSEKIVRSLVDVGNTTSSSIPIALSREVWDAKDNPQILVISGFGVGLSWASSVLFRT